MDFVAVRDSLLADHSLRGRGLCVAYTELIDAWLAELYAATIGVRTGVALVAIGGHGRGELAPGGDIDLMLLHTGGTSEADAAALWYPIWDVGLKLGHSVRTGKEALGLARDDLATATSLLSARPVAGDEGLARSVAQDALAQWRRRGSQWLERLAKSVVERHASAPEVAFALEPDLKEGRGGLRDVQAIGWAHTTGALGTDAWGADEADAVGRAYDLLLDVRVALHRATRRTGDLLVLQEQDAVAELRGDVDADALMAEVAAAGRTIAWLSDELWFDAAPRRRSKVSALPTALSIDRGRVRLASSVAPTAELMLDASIAAATSGGRIERDSLRQFATIGALATPWSDQIRDRFVALLRCGSPTVAVAEALDHSGCWATLVPEWPAVRSRPQRNAYHRFTVDRHLLEATTNAAALADRVTRPDLLLLGALFHDIGKGYPGDHTVVGMDLVAKIGPRMGLGPDDTATLVAMVEHHLLLPDVATRRDLDDPVTIERVASAVGAVERLRLLHCLTEADSIATGASAWGQWKATLVADLVDRVEAVLAGSEASTVTGTAHGAHWDEMIEAARTSGDPQLRVTGDRVTVVCADRPGLFSRVAGTLALGGLDVTDAVVTTVRGLAVEELRVSSRLGIAIDGARVERDLRASLAGRLAISVRLAERARAYPAAPRAPKAFGLDVRVLSDESADATVIEVVGPDSVGLLYRLTQSLAELDLDITRARVATLGGDVVDTFYVRGADGSKVADPALVTEIRTALLFALGA